MQEERVPAADGAEDAVADARCVKPALQRSVQPLPHANKLDAALGKVLALVRTLWLRERQLMEELVRLEEQLEDSLSELVRAQRAVKRRERKVVIETRELEAKKLSLETYKHILAAPVSRKPQTVLEDSEEYDKEEVDDSEGVRRSRY